MKPNRASNLRELKPVELEQKLGEARENLRKLTMRQVTRQLEDNVSVRIARRDVARVTTILKEKAMAEASKAAPAAKE